jgi:hypothetical protein
VTLAALKALADDGVIERDKVAEAMVKYGIDPSTSRTRCRSKRARSLEHEQLIEVKVPDIGDFTTCR